MSQQMEFIKNEVKNGQFYKKWRMRLKKLSLIKSEVWHGHNFHDPRGRRYSCVKTLSRPHDNERWRRHTCSQGPCSWILKPEFQRQFSLSAENRRPWPVSSMPVRQSTKVHTLSNIDISSFFLLSFPCQSPYNWSVKPNSLSSSAMMKVAAACKRPIFVMYGDGGI